MARRDPRHKLALLVGVLIAMSAVLFTISTDRDAPRSPPSTTPPDQEVDGLQTRASAEQQKEGAKLCTARVRTIDLDGAPLADLSVQLVLSEGPRRQTHRTDHQGIVAFSNLPCGSSGTAHVGNDWHLTNLVELPFYAILNSEVVDLPVDLGVPLQLRVVNPAGEPIAGATVNGLPSQFTDARGAVTVRMPSRKKGHVMVSAINHRAGLLEFDPQGADADQTQTLVLEYGRHVQLAFVSGTPEEDSGMSLYCSADDDQRTEMDPCGRWSDDGSLYAKKLMCPCPAGRALVWGEGLEVAVAPEDTVVTIDLASELVVTGRLLHEGDPLAGWVAFHPISEEEPGGGAWEVLGGPTVTANADGRFSTDRLSPGRWELVARSGEITAQLGLFTIPAAVAAFELGDLEVGGRGGIEGPCPDPAPSPIPLTVHALPVGVSQPPRKLTGGCFGGAAWLIDGLEPGRWRVWESHNPGLVREIDVEPGVIHDGIVFDPQSEIHQPTLGFTVRYDLPETEEEIMRLGVGVELVEVVPGSPAERAGLRAGMEVVEVHSPLYAAETAKGAPPGGSVFTLLEDDHSTIRLVVETSDGNTETISVP